DLAFLLKGELYIAGRIKEVIIQNGRNYYPQDIENTLQANFSCLRRDGGAAFSEDIQEGERLIVVHEVERTARNLNFDKIIPDMQQAIARSHDLVIHEIVLIYPGALPRTSSGKIQRLAARTMLRKNEFKVLARFLNTPANEAGSEQSDVVSGKKEPSGNDFQSGPFTSEDLIEIIRDLLARELNRQTDEISLDLSFQQQGVDSVAGIGVLGLLEQTLGLHLESTLIYEYPNVRALAGALSEQIGQPLHANGQKVSNSRSERSDTVVAIRTSPSGPGLGEVAIVGMACRFPGAPNLREFERLLESGTDAIHEADAERLELCGSSLIGHRAGWLSDIDNFDANFFSISPREAMSMDPQQRMLLELAYETLENADQPTGE
ncbi:MAG: hypothetical protein KDK37_19140, partial [Leptospiraceae bacterium]|nr:hypothetical protein [Leptospiraceae bacterium]